MSELSTAGLAITLSGALLSLSGCGKIEEWQTPGLAQCEAFTKSALRSPSTYKRVSFVVIDTPVSKQMLADATFGPGFESLASPATAPGLRGIALDYDAENSFGGSTRGETACYFPMSDIKNDEPFGDFEPLQSMAERSVRMGKLGLGETDERLCCLASTFDVSTIPTDGAE